jgi:hypothetical protein
MADPDPFYQPAVSAWFDSSLEHDRSLLVLSSGAIGLLVTLLTTVGVGSGVALTLHIGALFAFLVCIGSVLLIFRRNREYLQKLIETKSRENDPVLGFADTVAITSFSIGVLFTVAVGIGTAIESFASRERVMSKDKQPVVQVENLRESFNKAGSLQNNKDSIKSFNGAGGLQTGGGQTSGQGTSSTSGSSSTTGSGQGSGSQPAEQPKGK